jgi:hypothetical protein
MKGRRSARSAGCHLPEPGTDRPAARGAVAGDRVGARQEPDETTRDQDKIPHNIGKCTTTVSCWELETLITILGSVRT